MKLVKKISLLGLLMTVITIDVHATNKAFPKKFGISCGIATDPTFLGSTLLATTTSLVFSQLLLEILLYRLRKKMDKIRSEIIFNRDWGSFCVRCRTNKSTSAGNHRLSNIYCHCKYRFSFVYSARERFIRSLIL